MKRIVNSRLILDAVAAVTLSPSGLIEDYRHAVLDVILTGFTGTIKVKVSNQDEAPNFAGAVTPANLWSYMDLVGRDDGGSTITGTTGIVTTTITAVRSYAVNSDAVRWIAVDVEARSAGTVSALLSGATNE